METSNKAYEKYLETCERYGVESVNFHFFINHLTEEQLIEFSHTDI